MSDNVDAYIARTDGWPEAVAALRPILLGCGLDEAIKWNKPCYSHDGTNIAIMQEMKNYLALMFFKGALLSDKDGKLHDQGPNSRSARRLQFTSVDEVAELKAVVENCVKEAIVVEAKGLEVGPAPELVLVDELQEALAKDPALAEAFDDLTPGRQRGYNLHISGAKQAKTRVSRVEKCIPKIMDGKGFHDR